MRRLKGGVGGDVTLFTGGNIAGTFCYEMGTHKMCCYRSRLVLKLFEMPYIMHS